MNESRFTGYFPNTSLARIKDALLGAVSEEDIRERVTLSGDEFTVDNNFMELYVYSSDPGKVSGTNYLASGQYFGSIAELEALLQKLAALFADRGLVYEFEYYEETEGGDQVGDSKTLRHPDFP